MSLLAFPTAGCLASNWPKMVTIEPIAMPGMQLRQVANGQEQRLQLEDGQW